MYTHLKRDKREKIAEMTSARKIVNASRRLNVQELLMISNRVDTFHCVMFLSRISFNTRFPIKVSGMTAHYDVSILRLSIRINA